MGQTSSEADTFKVGICMAGAVSAGAYTAGVMDYLIEALQEWENQRGNPGVPGHKVEIPVIGGASAGGMTGIIVASALNGKITPIDKPTDNLMEEHPENKFYNAWVDLTGEDMFSKMLDTSDIKPGEVVSGLNSNFIDDIANKMVATPTTGWQALPEFIADDLKVFTTLSNLAGFNYGADFQSAGPHDSKYKMVVHNDYACFQLTERTDIVPPNNGWIPLNLKNGINLQTARDAAMATGAFPVGLKSRQLNRDAAYVNAIPFLHDVLTNTPVANGQLNTLNVDGGLINNEPFEKVRQVLQQASGQPQENGNDHNTFTSTVLMIEPFPTKEPVPISKSQNILNVVGLTLSSMITQMRSKPIQIANALDDNCAGQYLISPARIVVGPDGVSKDITGELAIACGALNGFSGFLNKEFRVHDYFLGRYNCKVFLRDYFTVPATALTENKIFANGYAGIDASKFKSTKEDAYQIIPVFADKTDYTFPNFKFRSGTNWPIIQEQDIDKFESGIGKRVQALLLNSIDLSWLNKGLLWLGAKALLNRMLTKSAIETVKSNLREWELLK